MSDNNGKIYLDIQALLARSPRRSRGIRVASGFEFSVCVSVCLSAYLFVLCKFSNIISYDNIIWYRCHMMSYDVIWYHMIKFSNIISYHIISYHIISYHIISYHIISYHMMKFSNIIWYHIISYLIISYHIISYLIIWYHMIKFSNIISNHIISYHIISYHIILGAGPRSRPLPLVYVCDGIYWNISKVTKNTE